MKTAALDIGDVWTGVAISDPLGITCRPYTTVRAEDLVSFITTFIRDEGITTIVVGHPQTLRGTLSEQTKKVEHAKDVLQEQFSAITWVLWDERMTSKQAATIKQAKTKEDKKMQHAIAAALILRTYLDSVAWNRGN